ncbi:hypothetical protein [Verminephrobacter aporrectodeae]|nr:hypothetical protein [Verminephrobacter aporrectodeae]
MNSVEVKIDLTYGAEEEVPQKYGVLVATFDPVKQTYSKFVITFNKNLDAFDVLYDQPVAIQVMYDTLTSPVVESKHNDWLKKPIVIENFEMPKHVYVVSVSSIPGTGVVDSDEFDL